MHNRIWIRLANAVLLCLFGLTAVEAFAQCDASWLGGAGTWNTPLNWSTGTVPDSPSVSVCIDNDNPAASPVTLDINATIQNLTIDSDDSLAVANGRIFTVNSGSIRNSGLVTLNAAGGNVSDVSLTGGGTVTLTGGGTLTMGNDVNNRIYGGNTTALVNGIGHTIVGAGQVGFSQTTITNNGTITCNQSAGMTLAPNGGGLTNTNLLQATSGATLTLQGQTLTNAGGTIQAIGAGSQVALSGPTVVGGTLSNSGGGLVRAISNSGLNGVIIQGTYENSNGVITSLQGTINNTGTITLNAAGGNVSDLSLVGGGTVTLTGGGTLLMGNNGNNRIYGGNTTAFINALGHAIVGAGQIGFGQTTITNNGVITTDQSAGMVLAPNGGGFTNTNLLQATSGATLTLQGTFTNTGATIQAVGTDSQVALSGATVVGGTLTSTGGGRWRAIGNSGLNGVTNNGTYENLNGVVTSLQGTINNTGVITLNAAGGNVSDVSLVGGDTVTLTGSGTVMMGNDVNNRIYGNNTTALLIDTVQTIQGAGNIGLSQTAITNKGMIAATQPAGLTVAPNGTGLINQGTLQATGAGILMLAGGPFDNSAGTIVMDTGTTGNVSATVNGGPVNLMSGASLHINGGTIHGGTLTNNATGIIDVNGSGRLGGAVANPLSGQLNVNNGTILTLESSGTYANNGSWSLNAAGGNVSDLSLVGDQTVTLSGTGTLNMGNNFNNRIYGGNTTAFLNGAGHTIQGAGQIGFGQTTIGNDGVITANQSAGMAISPNGGGTTNTNLLQATNGATLALSGTVHNSGKATLGTIQAVGSGSLVTLGGATVEGGILSSSGGGLVRAVSNSALIGVANQGAYENANGVVVSLQGTIANTGTMTLNAAGGNVSDFSLIGGGTVTLSGLGILSMITNDMNNRIYGGNTTALINAVDHTIQGAGQIGFGQTAIINNGLIAANQSVGIAVSPNGGGFTNNGTLQVGSGSLLRIFGGPLFTNYNSGTNTLTGGVYGVTGTLQFDSANIMTNAATIVMDGAASAILDQTGQNGLRNFSTNSATGSFTIQSGRNFTSPVDPFQNAGTLAVGNSSTFTGAINSASGATLSGTGSIVGSITNAGTVTTEFLPATAGTLSITGSFTQTTDGSLRAGLGGTDVGQFDKLTISDTANLHGTLAVSLLPPFFPNEGDTFTVITFASRVGTFDNVTGLDIGGGLVLQLMYNDTDVTLKAVAALSPLRR